MSEYIGCQISLISKSEIRYVGVLHQIDSDSATVALKEVRSYGTEGRKANANPPGEEIPAGDHVYDYIVFRGNDVAHLNIIQKPDESHPPRPQMPDDPAIIGTDRPPYQQQQPPPPQQWQQQQHQQQYPPQQNMQPQYPPYGYPPQQNSRFQGPGGPHGFPGAPGAVPGYGMPPYNGPPGGGWYQGPPGQNFPPGPPGQAQEQRPFTPNGGRQGLQPNGPSPMNTMQQAQGADATGKPPVSEQGPQQRQQPGQIPGKSSESPQEPRPTELSATPTRPSATTAAARRQDDKQRTQNRGPGAQVNRDSRVALPRAPAQNTFASIAAKGNTPVAQPAVPQQSARPAAAAPIPAKAQPPASTARDNQDVTSRAAAAVAAAMAKLGTNPGQPSATSTKSTINDLTRKINDTRISSDNRGSRTQGGQSNNQRGRGGPRRGGAPRQNGTPIEIPQTDFDFDSANAKLNKSDILREATAAAALSSPVGTPGADNESGATPDPAGAATAAIAPIPIPAPGSTYDKKSSFFDNISSDLKDRTEDAANAANGGTGAGSGPGGMGRGGANTRYAQRKQNMETFGQANVDGGAGYHRGHGRGRGRGYGRGRGGYQRFEARGGGQA